MVDKNHAELGPPAALLATVTDAEAEPKLQGLCDDGADDAAWDRVDFGDAYREFLETDADTCAALADLEFWLAAGESIALVCDESTEQKRCHRTVLRARLEDRLAGDYSSY
ncbi:hypothetical protein C446_15628 [Halobiforma nitratireducens JCM 10879]|uniref:DUF488 domain-containing protein n=1 Tax=Halobiforma nitratireducens JCM 10879 TaxID=1227454 RepID=M0LCV6_9EURY|nr:hypothetical protein C446_15628 [Halobiforma nitratireducens JCM 10879]